MVISKGNVSRGYVRLPSFTDLSVIGISHWHRYHAVDTLPLRRSVVSTTVQHVYDGVDGAKLI